MALFEFQSHISLEEPSATLGLASVVSVILFIFGLSLLGSRFVFSPGIDIQLPHASDIQSQSTLGMITIGQNGMIIFNDKILSLEELGPELKLFLEQKKHDDSPRILIRMDRSIPIANLVGVSESAKIAGFKKIQLACEK